MRVNWGGVFLTEFLEFPKIARLSRECVVTEKIDGTNAQVFIAKLDDYLKATDAVANNGDLYLFAGSRNRYITPVADNHGFAAWVVKHADALWALGEGRHYGEWWGSGVQRGYGLTKGDKRFSLFNVARWHQQGNEPYISVSADPRQPPKSSQEAPACCSVVPALYRGEFDTSIINGIMTTMREQGSRVAPGFMNPEGVVVYHVAANLYFKKTLEKDAAPKSLAVA